MARFRPSPGFIHTAFTAYIIPCVVALSTSWGLVLYTRSADDKQKAVDVFWEQAVAFQAVGFALSDPIITRSALPDSKVREELVANLMRQSQAVGAIGKYLPPSEQSLVERYQQELLEVRRIGLSVGPLTLSDFYNASRKLVADRTRIIMIVDAAKLSSAANIPSTPETPGGPAPPP